MTEDTVTTFLSFRIFAPDLDIDHVTELLGLEPDHAHRMGELRWNKRSKTFTSPYKTSMWLIHSRLAPEAPLEAHFDNVLSLLEPRQAEIRQLARSAEIDFGFDLWGQIGFGLPAETVHRIASMGAALSVCVYGFNED